MPKNQIELPRRKQLEAIILDSKSFPILEASIDYCNKRLSEIKSDAICYNSSKPLDRTQLSDLFKIVKKDVDIFLEVSEIKSPTIVAPQEPYTLIHDLKSVPGTCLILGGVLYFSIGASETLGNLNNIPNLSNSLLHIGIGASCILAGSLLGMIINPNPNCYYAPLGKISVLNYNEQEASLILAHEYTHHIQKLKWGTRGFCGRIVNPAFNSFCEGFARGVERNIAGFYTKITGDTSYEATCLEKRHIPELKVVYDWLCKQTNQKPNKDLMGNGYFQDLEEKHFFKKRPNDYAIGNTALYLKEITQGRRIYQNIIAGNFEFSLP